VTPFPYDAIKGSDFNVDTTPGSVYAMPGDSLTRIAARWAGDGATAAQINDLKNQFAQANPQLTDLNQLAVGQQLNYPGAGTVVGQSAMARINAADTSYIASRTPAVAPGASFDGFDVYTPTTAQGPFADQIYFQPVPVTVTPGHWVSSSQVDPYAGEVGGPDGVWVDDTPIADPVGERVVAAFQHPGDALLGVGKDLAKFALSGAGAPPTLAPYLYSTNPEMRPDYSGLMSSLTPNTPAQQGGTILFGAATIALPEAWATFGDLSIGSDLATVGDAANSARGLSRNGGIFGSTTNEAGGTVWTSQGPISQNDFGHIVNSELMQGRDVNIITGVHGNVDGTIASIDPEMHLFDVDTFGEIPGVTVHNFPELTPDQLKALLNGKDTVIGGFCSSGACLAPYQ
jgi:hypothetical protein